ncbi:MAG: DUF542 domain-containing protein [Gemmatimonadaceae bacterium]|nr:DUF542 domain-containing protein [Gemmatimonadaceae bacterium]NUQ93102.1 DUF542 domain-containing protein [Gemmatimonadaceae bacterium]NUR20625.1 DUF542 domain-containing protein [Gemmatimonadaceae bacterium]NUS97501.1 DUF542 domain-containing protein [Gemmatimonadaceae bacterium]
MPTLPLPIDENRIVNDVLADYPGTFAIFHDFGIDACCGGAESIAVSAERDGADLSALLTALREATAERQGER